MNYPKVLVVSASSLEGRDATGLTISSLFGDWPTDKLWQVVDLSGLRRVKGSRHPWKTIKTKDFFSLAGKAIPTGVSANVYRQSSSRMSLAGKMISTIKAVREISKKIKTSDIFRWVEEFEPEVVYSTGGSLCWCRLVNQLAVHFNIPAIYHFMDDWPATVMGNTFFKKRLRGRVSALIEQSLDKGALHLTISSDMAKEYESRYQRKFLAFMRCLKSWPTVAGTRVLSSNPIRLVFIGSLHLGRWAVLKKLGEALDLTGPAGTIADVFAPSEQLNQYAGAFGGLHSLRLAGHIEPGYEQNILSGYDVAVHVESYNESTADFARLSISTKIPLYFSVGLPVLAVGPENLSSMRWIEKSGAGIVVDSTELGELSGAVESLARPDVWQGMAGASQKWFCGHHEAKAVQEAFRTAICRAANRLG